MRVLAVLGRGFDHDCLEFGIECLDEIQEAAAGGHSVSPENFGYLKVYSFFCLLVVAGNMA